MSYIVVAFRDPARWGSAEFEKLKTALPGVGEELVRAAFRAVEPTSGGLRSLYLRNLGTIIGTRRSEWGWVQEEGGATTWPSEEAALGAAREQFRASGLFHVAVGRREANGCAFAEQVEGTGAWRYYGPELDVHPPVCRTCACVRSEGAPKPKLEDPL